MIIAGGGNDSIRSRQGKDFVCAGRGDNTIHAAEGVNYMSGGPGADWLDGRRGEGNLSIGGRGPPARQPSQPTFRKAWKPPGCGARYCAGDVAGERGDRADVR